MTFFWVFVFFVCSSVGLYWGTKPFTKLLKNASKPGKKNGFKNYCRLKKFFQTFGEGFQVKFKKIKAIFQMSIFEASKESFFWNFKIC